MNDDWMIYRKDADPHHFILPEPPPWRARTPKGEDRDDYRGRKYRIDADTALMVNAAMYLRRALLVTGKPGSGKSTLAYSIAWQLKLGRVLKWAITSSSTVKDGLYSYDAIGRMQAKLLEPELLPPIERFLSLGPLGSALAPSPLPRVLLIDEIDKSDIDLPNDLLDIFEEGEFEIPELARLETPQSVAVRLYRGEKRAEAVDDGSMSETTRVQRGAIRCTQFPIVILTSNGEREFPPAFLRRCLQLKLRAPERADLEAIVATHLEHDPRSREIAPALIDRFLAVAKSGDLATDQLLNAIHMVMQGPDSKHDLVDAIYRTLSNS